MVHAPQKLQRPVPSVSGLIAGSIEPLSRCQTECIGNKSFCGEIRSLPIASCQTIAADIQFTRDFDRSKIEIYIEKVHVRVRDRPPDRYNVVGTGHRRHRRPYRRFGWAIQIVRRHLIGQKFTSQFSRERLTPAQDSSRRDACSTEQRPPPGRSRLHDGCPDPFKLHGQSRAVDHHITADNRRARSDEQRQEQFQNSNIKRHGRGRRNHVVAVRMQRLDHGQQEVHDTAMSNHDSLGLAR